MIACFKWPNFKWLLTTVSANGEQFIRTIAKPLIFPLYWIWDNCDLVWCFAHVLGQLSYRLPPFNRTSWPHIQTIAHFFFIIKGVITLKHVLGCITVKYRYKLIFNQNPSSLFNRVTSIKKILLHHFTIKTEPFAEFL